MTTLDHPQRTIWLADSPDTVQIIDQRRLPHEMVIVDLTRVDQTIRAIQTMQVRGAPLIGATGAWGVYLAARAAAGSDDPKASLTADCQRLRDARPTATNLVWAVDRVQSALPLDRPVNDWIAAARAAAEEIVEQEVAHCRQIGEHGVSLISRLHEQAPTRPVNILTHCNAGWLACIEWGTATAPIYVAHEQGIPVHVWVDETRPLNQGARLTAWELEQAGVPHTVITDNAGGHLMQHGRVDLVITGTDRTTRSGDVANKIGTYLKALAAADNGIPFYVALPSSTFDWQLTDGLSGIPIEERDPDEVRIVSGWTANGPESVQVPLPTSPAANPAFDVTPARLVTGLITERGICRPDETDIRRLFEDKWQQFQE